jgi:hypothetical protein
VEYRIFGPGGAASEDFKRDFHDLLKLDDAQRIVIRDWFLSSKNYDAFASPLPANIVASTLLPEQFQHVVQMLRRLLWAWEEYRLELEDVERDLLLLGFNSEALAVLGPFLADLSMVKDKVWAREYAQAQAIDGLPTMDTLNFVCDARAVFGGYPNGDDDRIRDSYRQFLGVIPIVIMELIASDNYGNKKRMAVQLSEEHFEWLQKAVGRAQEQFSILKERTAAVAFSGNGPH